MKSKVVVIGGGAAGFFAAISAAESNPNLEIIILEKASKVLQKVKVSGGGRCNVTHACFTPKELVEFYPRGKRELLGPFHQFMTGDTMEWFESKGVKLKIENDNRVFPVSNNSQTIIDCLSERVQNLGISILLNKNVESIKVDHEQFKIETKNEHYIADAVLIASGGNSKMWNMISNLGYKIIKPVPSLFTFNIKDRILEDIPGVSVPNATVSIKGFKNESTGPLLITHWGISGPAVLKLSSFAAIYLASCNYKYEVKVNWISKSLHLVLEDLKQFKSQFPKKNVLQNNVFKEIPKRLWQKFILNCDISESIIWADLSNKKIIAIAELISSTTFKADGKSTFKEEFVTAGGVDLKAINFKRFESKIHKNLYFAGEVLNIDAVTGGFNFQNAWTGGYIAGKSIAEL